MLDIWEMPILTKTKVIQCYKNKGKKINENIFPIFADTIHST